jgi:hypothetical protein
VAEKRYRQGSDDDADDLVLEVLQACDLQAHRQPDIAATDEQLEETYGGDVGDRSDQEQVDDLDDRQRHRLGGLCREVARLYELDSGGQDAAAAHQHDPRGQEQAPNDGHDQQEPTSRQKSK